MISWLAFTKNLQSFHTHAMKYIHDHWLYLWTCCKHDNMCPSCHCNSITRIWHFWGINFFSNWKKTFARMLWKLKQICICIALILLDWTAYTPSSPTHMTFQPSIEPKATSSGSVAQHGWDQVLWQACPTLGNLIWTTPPQPSSRHSNHHQDIYHPSGAMPCRPGSIHSKTPLNALSSY